MIDPWGKFIYVCSMFLAACLGRWALVGMLLAILVLALVADDDPGTVVDGCDCVPDQKCSRCQL